MKGCIGAWTIGGGVVTTGIFEGGGGTPIGWFLSFSLRAYWLAIQYSSSPDSLYGLRSISVIYLLYFSLLTCMSFNNHKSLGDISLYTLCLGIETRCAYPGSFRMLLSYLSFFLSFIKIKITWLNELFALVDAASVKINRFWRSLVAWGWHFENWFVGDLVYLRVIAS